jgi:hypothetical protein
MTNVMYVCMRACLGLAFAINVSASRWRASVTGGCCACAIEAQGTQNTTAFGSLYLKVQQLHGPCLSGLRHTDGLRLRSQPL